MYVLEVHACVYVRYVWFCLLFELKIKHERYKMFQVICSGGSGRRYLALVKCCMNIAWNLSSQCLYTTFIQRIDGCTVFLYAFLMPNFEIARKPYLLFNKTHYLSISVMFWQAFISSTPHINYSELASRERMLKCDVTNNLDALNRLDFAFYELSSFILLSYG